MWKINYMQDKPQMNHMTKKKLKYNESWKKITSGNQNVKKNHIAVNKYKKTPNKLIMLNKCKKISCEKLNMNKKHVKINNSCEKIH